MSKTGISVLKRPTTDKAVIYALFISVFLPYVITGVVIITAFVYIVACRNVMNFFKTKSGICIAVFSIYSVIVGAANLNYIGLLCSVGFFMLITIMLYIRSYADTELFECGLDLCCIFGSVVSILCYMEYYLNVYIFEYTGIYRCTLYYFNCNYLATVLATVIIICAYKVLTHQGHTVFYFIAAAFCAAAMYLTGSMFVWVEIFIGLAVYLLVSRRHQLLSVLLLLAGTLCVILYCVPELLPRLSGSSGVTTDNRVEVWLTAIKDIKANPFFGRGFLGYYHIYNNYSGSYYTTHCHNILLDTLLNFGIVGSIPLVTFFTIYIGRVIKCRNAQAKLSVSCIILALISGLVVHSSTDLTFLWIQTGLLYCLIFGGIGNEERLLKLDIN